MYHCCVPFLLPIGAVRVARSAENSDLTRTTRHQWPCRTAVRHCLPLSGPDFHTLHRGLWNSMSSHETSWNYSETFPIFEKCVCYVIYCYGIVMIMCIIYPLRQETSVIHRVIRRRWSTTGAVCRNLRNNIWFIVIRCHSLSLILQSPFIKILRCINFVFGCFFISSGAAPEWAQYHFDGGPLPTPSGRGRVKTLLAMPG